MSGKTRCPSGTLAARLEGSGERVCAILGKTELGRRRGRKSRRRGRRSRMAGASLGRRGRKSRRRGRRSRMSATMGRRSRRTGRYVRGRRSRR